MFKLYVITEPRRISRGIIEYLDGGEGDRCLTFFFFLLLLFFVTLLVRNVWFASLSYKKGTGVPKWIMKYELSCSTITGVTSTGIGKCQDDNQLECNTQLQCTPLTQWLLNKIGSKGYIGYDFFQIVRGGILCL